MGERPPHEYLQALCRGDNTLVKEMYTQFLPNISRWVRKNNGSEQDAEDLFQEALIAIFDRYCGEESPTFTSPFGALLFSICRNIWYSRLSQKKREEKIRFSEKERYESEADDPDLLVQAEETAKAHREEEVLKQTFRQLSELCQKVLRMMAEGKAGEDIAKELGMNNRSTVYVRAHKCKKRWRDLFNKSL